MYNRYFSFMPDRLDLKSSFSLFLGQLIGSIEELRWAKDHILGLSNTDPDQDKVYMSWYLNQMVTQIK